MKCIPAAIAFPGIFALLVLADDKPIDTPTEALKMTTSINVKYQGLDSVVRDLEKQVQHRLAQGSSLKFEIKILTEDLKFEGFTRNIGIRDFKQQDQPLRDVLTALVRKGNQKSVNDPSNAEQRLVWVVGPDPDDADRQVILITTRRAAAQRSYKLPDVFVPKKK